jgi:hypothetical protein
VSEAALVASILLAYGMDPKVKLFRQNTGKLQDRTGRWVSFGLCPGSSDIIGWKSVPYGCAVFVAIECKAPGKRATPQQAQFLAAVLAAGGIAIVARSLTDVVAVLGPPTRSG